jgi:hypothetical protein
VSENPKRIRPEQAQPCERRRIGTVVHDERGNASVEWQAAPDDHERPVLEVQGEDSLRLTREEVSYDPYARNGPPRRGAGKRTDLRKLSEWIKKMRELEERKRSGGDPEEE